MTTIVSYPLEIPLGQSFNIEVSSAVPGQYYIVVDETSGQFLTPFDPFGVGVPTVPSANFTIVCNGLSGSTGAHTIKLYFYDTETEELTITITATPSGGGGGGGGGWTASINPTYNGALFRSSVVYWYDIATSDTPNTISSATAKTFVLNNVYLSPTTTIEVDDFIRVRPTNNPGLFPGIEARVNSYNPTTQTLELRFSSWPTAGVTTSSWFFDFGQPKIQNGEDVVNIFPISITGTPPTLTYSQVDLGNGLLPSWLTLNSSTGEITGRVPELTPPESPGAPGAQMAPYQIGISVSDGFSTQVLTWTFGGVTGFWAAAITDPSSRQALYTIPVGFLYPEGTIQLRSFNATTGALIDNGYTTLGAGSPGIGAGSGSLPFATPTPGIYAFNGRAMAFEGSSYYVDFWFGGSYTPVTNRLNGGVTIFEGAPPALTTVTNTATYRINEPIAPLTIATGSGGSYPLRYILRTNFVPDDGSVLTPEYLPEGLSFNTSTGVITGTPTSYGAIGNFTTPYLYDLRVTDGVRESNVVGFNIFIRGPLTATTTLPNSIIIVGVPVSFTPVSIINEVGTTTWAINPSVPSGLTFDTANGQISGTASGTSSTTTYSVTVTDSDLQVSTATFTLSAETSNLATTLAVPSLTLSINVGMTPTTPVTHTGGYGNVVYSISPALPNNLVFNTTNGEISGTPATVQGATSYTIQVRDDANQISSQVFSLTVLDQLSAVVLEPELSFERGTAIDPVKPVEGEGGVPPYSYSVFPTLPTGLTYNGTNGFISGTPNISSTATSYTVTVADSNSKFASAGFTLRVQPLVVNASTLTVIKAIDYNDIKFLTEEILGENVLGYGYQGIKSNVTATTGNIIGWEEWTNLKDDINLCTEHHTGAAFSYTTASVVTSLFVNQLIDNLNSIESIRFNRPHLVATGTTSSVWTSTYVSTWGSFIDTTATLTWAEGLDINYFFNLGGSIEFELNYLPSDETANNLGWQTLIDESQPVINDFVYNRESYLGFTTVSTSTTSTTGSVVLSVTKNLNTLTCSIELINNLAGTTDLQVEGVVKYVYSDTVLPAPLPREIDLKEFNTGTFVPVIVPVKALRISAPTNIYSWNIGSSSSPQTITIQNTGNQPVSVSGITFNDNASVDRIVNGTTNGSIGAFTVTTTSNYTFTLAYTGAVQGSFSSQFTVNAESPVGALTTSTRQLVGAQPFSITVTPPSIDTSIVGSTTWLQDFLINSINGDAFEYQASLSAVNVPTGATGFSVSTDLSTGPVVSYSGIGAESTFVGEFNTGTVYSITQVGGTDFTLVGAANSNLGTTFTAQNLVDPTLPPGLEESPFVAGRYYRIVSVAGSDFTLFGAASNTVGTLFVLDDGISSPGSPVTIAGGGRLAQGNGKAIATLYTATVDLIVTATSSVSSLEDTVTVPISLDTQVSATYNLGTWVSPLAANNAVIGMSYDVISGERYLTIGVGMGADGSVPLNVGGISSVDVANLGINADPDFKQGQRLYPVVGGNQASDWSPFLKALGSWPNSIPEQPYNINVGITPTYRFYAPVTGNYSYEFSVDDDGYFLVIPADEYGLNTGRATFLTPSLMNGGASSNWRQSYTGTITLTAGWYILRYWHTNYARKTASAFQIKDPSGNVIWNTRYPVRSSPNYLYWQDVIRMRVPADGTPRDLFSSLWYIKNTYQVSNKAHWGYYFNPDMFKVTDDGSGNLNIVLFGNPRAPLLTDPNAAADKSTIKALSAAFYYYLPSSLDLIRYTNLDSGPAGDGTQTRYFTGFNRDGAVLTVLQTIPSSIPDPIPTNPNPGGGGGGGSDDFEDFINQQLR